jgi:hypothetical protein
LADVRVVTVLMRLIGAVPIPSRAKASPRTDIHTTEHWDRIHLVSDAGSSRGGGDVDGPPVPGQELI